MKVRKVFNSILVLAFMAAVFALAAGLIRNSDERMLEQAAATVESTGTETVTTYSFEGGSLVGQVSALAVGGAEPGLQGRFDAALGNGLKREIKLRGVEAVTRGTRKSLKEFQFSFKKTTLAPGQRYAFGGTVPVSTEFFKKAIRKYDVALRVVTDVGVLELPLGIYTLEVEPALKTGLLQTNQVVVGDSQGIINFLNCEQASAEEVCEPMLEQMGAL